MGRYINPDLQHVACRHTIWPNYGTKHGLWRRRLAEDEVGRLAGGASSQVLPGWQIRRLSALGVDVWRHAVNEPKLEHFCRGEEREAGPAAAQHFTELGLPIARE